MHVFESQVVERRVAEQFRGGMSRAVCPPGSKLPPGRDLAKSLGLSGPSMREAFIALEVAGLIEVSAGSGIYVRPTATRFMQLGS
jgi:DNA-binding FadR family transcriptional regulator